MKQCEYCGQTIYFVFNNEKNKYQCFEVIENQLTQKIHVCQHVKDLRKKTWLKKNYDSHFKIDTSKYNYHAKKDIERKLQVN